MILTIVYISLGSFCVGYTVMGLYQTGREWWRQYRDEE